MSTLSPAAIYSLAVGAGLSPAAATTATAVALAESGGRTDAQGDVGLEDGTWGPSVGLWQIRSLKAQYGTGGARDASRLTDPQFNAAAMAQISGAGGNFKPWTTFTKGTYKQYLSQVGSTAVTADDVSAASSSSSSGGQSVAASVGGWMGLGSTFFTVGLKVLGAAAAAGLVIVGAVHTVSDK